jgi:peptidoglycan/xylan/chitin deacetylase (PgdA/CDA1 family)
VKSKLTIITYHYVRDFSKTKYPNIKGLDLVSFKDQISFLKKNYNIITIDELINFNKKQIFLPPNPALLTFDDGYIDHYEFVFPELLKQNVQGSFFPPAKPIIENNILDVHKAQFIIACAKSENHIVEYLMSSMDLHKEEYCLKSFDYYYEFYAKSNRWWSKNIKFFKSMIQFVLPEDLRNKICNEMFIQFVTKDEVSFSKELYLETEQLRHMVEEGMHIGSHGFEHYWLGSLSGYDQELDIKKSIKFLKSIGQDMRRLSIAYPYGSYNEKTLEILKKLNFSIGFATEYSVCDLSVNNFFALPRLDTNDIPM